MFALATLGGYLLSVWAGLFGFTEVRTTAGIFAGVIEVAAFAALAALAARPRPPGRPSRAGAARPGGRLAGRGSPGAAAAMAAYPSWPWCCSAWRSRSAGGPSGAGPPADPAARGPEDHHDQRRDGAHQRQGLHPVLVRPGHPNPVGLHWGLRAVLAAVTGGAAAGPGVTGRLGTITRSDGSRQATYDGHPLYTYIADTAPGQAHGNNLNLNGGVWHEVMVSDTKPIPRS